MTEKEKMLSGMLYLHSDEQLMKEHMRAVELMSAYNATTWEQEEERRVIMRQLANMKGSFVIEQRFRCVFGYNITIGDDFYANFDLQLLDVAPITIGAHVLIGPNVIVCTAGHPVDPEIRRTKLEFGKPITIGDNVWIGAGSIILPGVSIGEDSVIGAGSVVTKDVPAGVVAAGNPAAFLKRARQHCEKNGKE